MSGKHLVYAVTILILVVASPGVLRAQPISEVSPPMLDLVLGNGDVTVEQVSWTFHPLCVRPFEVDVVASDPAAALENLTGVLLNSCGGDTSAFDIRFTGDGVARSFELQFVDAEFGGVLDTIPTTISIPEPASCVLLALGMLLAARRPARGSCPPFLADQHQLGWPS